MRAEKWNGNLLENEANQERMLEPEKQEKKKIVFVSLHTNTEI